MSARRVARWALIAALLPALGLSVLSGCFLPDSYSQPNEPVAVRAGESGVEILYVACQPVGVERVEVVQVPDGQNWVNENDPVIWRISFSPPAKVGRFVVGQRADGGTEDVPLTTTLGERTYYAVRVFLEGGAQLLTSFERFRLANGKVNYDGTYVSAKDFEKRSACGSPART